MAKLKVFFILLIACLCCYFIISLLLGLLLGSGYEVYRPEEGIWYCEDLGITLSFDDHHDSYFLSKGRKVHCIWENNKGSKVITLLCQETIPGDFMIGDLVFCGQYITLDTGKFVVKDVDSGESYTFIRQDKIDLVGAD